MRSFAYFRLLAILSLSFCLLAPGIPGQDASLPAITGGSFQRGTIDTQALEALVIKRLKKIARELIDKQLEKIFEDKPAALRIIMQDTLEAVRSLKDAKLAQRLIANIIILTAVIERSKRISHKEAWSLLTDSSVSDMTLGEFLKNYREDFGIQDCVPPATKSKDTVQENCKSLSSEEAEANWGAKSIFTKMHGTLEGVQEIIKSTMKEIELNKPLWVLLCLDATRHDELNKKFTIDAVKVLECDEDKHYEVSRIEEIEGLLNYHYDKFKTVIPQFKLMAQEVKTDAAFIQVISAIHEFDRLVRLARGKDRHFKEEIGWLRGNWATSKVAIAAQMKTYWHVAVEPITRGNKLLPIDVEKALLEGFMSELSKLKEGNSFNNLTTKLQQDINRYSSDLQAANTSLEKFDKQIAAVEKKAVQLQLVIRNMVVLKQVEATQIEVRELLKQRDLNIELREGLIAELHQLEGKLERLKDFDRSLKALKGKAAKVTQPIKIKMNKLVEGFKREQDKLDTLKKQFATLKEVLEEIRRMFASNRGKRELLERALTYIKTNAPFTAYCDSQKGLCDAKVKAYLIFLEDIPKFVSFDEKENPSMDVAGFIEHGFPKLKDEIFSGGAKFYLAIGATTVIFSDNKLSCNPPTSPDCSGDKRFNFYHEKIGIKLNWHESAAFTWHSNFYVGGILFKLQQTEPNDFNGAFKEQTLFGVDVVGFLWRELIEVNLGVQHLTAFKGGTSTFFGVNIAVPLSDYLAALTE